MAAGIVYLDVDDEITSAAQRIRSSAATKVALVVPYGSRIATSRMNFRLLSREALVSNRRLTIISGDAASRSLAASAGLPVFASVAEYEGAVESGGDRPTDDGRRRSAATTAAAGTLAASETVAAVGPAAPEPPATPPTPSTGPAASAAASARAMPDDTTRMTVPLAATAGATAPPVRAPGVPADTGRTPAPAPPRVADRSDDDAGRRTRTPLIVAAALIGLGVVVLAVGAYLLLPSASIAVTPRHEPISVDLTVSADPDATAVDPSTGVVPAVRLDVPVEASQTFTTTGVHVEQTVASGQVTFTNFDFTAPNTIPSGSIVATESGVQFRTQSSVFLPAATRLGVTIVPTKRAVAVTSVRAGTVGNVPANAIRIVPQGEDPNLVSVNNGSPTEGGTRTESPQVSQAEVDKALAVLQVELTKNFNDAIASGAGAPVDTTLFPETAVLGPATPAPDPKTLVGQAVSSYDLSLSASGTVIAVDPRPVRQIAEQQLQGKVGADHRLVDGSIDIEVGQGTVGEDGQVTFEATAHASRVPIVDANALRPLVKGKTKAEVEAALAPYGDVNVTLWPDWVSTVTGIDPRLDLTVNDATTGPSGSPSPGGGSARPTSTPPRTASPHASAPHASASAVP